MKVRNLTPRVPFPQLPPRSKPELSAEVSGLLVAHVRKLRRLSQKKLGALLGVAEGTIRRWEKGWPLPHATVERLAAVARLPMSHVEGVLIPAFEASVREAGSAPLDDVQEPAVEEDLVACLAEPLGPPFAAFEATFEEPALPASPSARDRELVPALAASFLAAPASKRYLLIERLACFQVWAFAEWLAHQSAVVAARDAQEALRLANLAVRAVKMATAGEKGPWCFRLLAYVWFFVANAHRVGNDYDAADAVFKKAISLWQRGEGGDPTQLLPEWRRLDLEASLRKDQHLFIKAHELLDQALALAPPAAEARILLKKGTTFVRMADFASALATLHRAAPRIDPKAEPRQPFLLNYLTVRCLLRLGRADEAAGLLPEVRALALALDNDLDLLRVRWLEGLVDAGLGKTEQARAAFEQVRAEFDSLNLPYDYALATLDLALVYREERRWSEIRGLAMEMVRIFEKRNIHREARAAVALFQEAAVKEAATGEFLRRLQDYLKLAERRPGLRFEARS